MACAGYRVTYLVADGRGVEPVAAAGDAAGTPAGTRAAGAKGGVEIVDAGMRPAKHRERFAFSASTMLAKARGIDADIYHFHDPELIPAGLALKRDGKIVIYDSHEDLPRQMLSKTYIAGAKAKLVALVAEWGEDFAAHRFDAVIAATDTIGARFAKHAKRTVIVNNYPSLEELGLEELPLRERTPKACYVGGLSVIRGSLVLAEAAKLCRFPIETAGPFDNPEIEAEILGPGAKLIHLGFLGRTELAELMTSSMTGVMTYLPRPNHVNALPTKLFDYMAAGLPVIVSDFPLWRSIVTENDCGLCVDPENPTAIAEAIERLLSDPAEAARMGANGRALVLAGRNWSTEEKKLLELYETLENHR